MTYISIGELPHWLFRLWLPCRVPQLVFSALRCRNGYGILVVTARGVLIPAINLPHSRRYGAIYQCYAADGYKNIGTWYRYPLLIETRQLYNSNWGFDVELTLEKNSFSFLSFLNPKIKRYLLPFNLQTHQASITKTSTTYKRRSGEVFSLVISKRFNIDIFNMFIAITWWNRIYHLNKLCHNGIRNLL